MWKALIWPSQSNWYRPGLRSRGISVPSTATFSRTRRTHARYITFRALPDERVHASVRACPWVHAFIHGLSFGTYSGLEKISVGILPRLRLQRKLRLNRIESYRFPLRFFCRNTWSICTTEPSLTFSLIQFCGLCSTIFYNMGQEKFAWNLDI